MFKKKRDTDAQDNDSSTESCDEKALNGSGAPTTRECTHIKKSVDPTKLRKILKASGIDTETCSECKKMAASLPSTDQDSDDVYEDDNTLWLCLKCGTQLCGRSKNQHALKHFQVPRSDSHAVAMNTTTFDIWCYSCDSEVSPNTRKNLRECVDMVKKMAQKPPPSAPIPLHYNINSVDTIQEKITTAIETMRPLLSDNGIDNNNSVIYGPPPPPPQPIPGMAKRIQPETPRLPACNTAQVQQFQQHQYPLQHQELHLPRVRGLTNLGNTCFFNAVMQCLAQTPFLLDVLRESSEPGEEFILPGGTFKFNNDQDVELPPIKGTLNSWGGLTNALAQSLDELQSSGGVFTPSKLFDKLCSKCPQFCGGDQHDSHELLRHLLESVRSEDLRRYQKVILHNLDLNDPDMNSVSEEMRKKCKIYGQQAADRILRPDQVFRGFLVSTLRCQECFHISSRHEYFLDISLPVSVEKPQPPVRRKNSPENPPTGPSKHQQKKEKEKERKAKRAQKHQHQKENNFDQTMQTDSSSSEQSDADVEDNLIDDNAGATSSKGSTAVKVNEVRPCDPNGNSNELLSPLASEKRGDSPENPNKDSLDDDENDSGIATSPPNITLNIQPRFGTTNGFEMFSDSNGSDKSTLLATNNKVMEVGLSEKGVSVVRQLSLSNDLLASGNASGITVKGGDPTEENNVNLAKEMAKLNLGGAGTGEKNDTAAVPKRTKTKRVRTQSYSDWSTTVAPRYQCDDGECSVQSCLNNFTAVELMTGNNRVGCDNCTKRINGEGGKTIYTNATKQFLISSPPAVLILHLKRFQIGQRSMFRKLTWPVSFPMLLDVAPFCGSKVKNLPNINRKQKKLLYALYGIVEHSGSMYGGHYTAYVKVRPLPQPDDKRWKFIPQGSKAELDQADEQREKLEELLAKERARDLRMKANDSDDFSTSCSSSEPEMEEMEPSPVEEPNITPLPGKWYHVSDSRVQEISEEKVLKAQAYLLFYERIY